MATSDANNVYTTSHLRISDTLTSSTASDPALASAVPAASSASLEAIKDITFGSAAGICGKFIEYPFDTVKVRLQSHVPTEASPPYRGPLDCFIRSYRYDGGFASLYRGISAPLLGAAIETSSLFLSYRIAQDVITWAVPTLRVNGREAGKAQLPFSALVVCGAASGAFTSILLTPIELVKCRMQVPAYTSSVRTRRGPVSTMATIFRYEGLLGFWHGQLGTLIRETGGSAAWFGSYEGVCKAFKHYSKTQVEENVQLPISQQLLAGAMAGMAYNFIFYPADTIKSRMQTEESPVSNGLKDVKKQTFARIGRTIWREHGIKGFYRGCGITVARAAPSSAFIFAIYEGLRAHFG